MKIVIIVLVTLCLAGCSQLRRFSEWQESAVRKGIEESNQEDLLWRERVGNKLSLGMLVSEFEREFGVNIFKREERRLYFYEPESRQKARVTFDNGVLASYERYGMGGNPWGYADCSFALRKR